MGEVSCDPAARAPAPRHEARAIGATLRIPRTPQPWRSPRTASVLRALALAILVAAFYHAWLQPGLITAGDWPYITLAGLKDMAPFPSLWNATSSTGTYDILAGPMFPLHALQGLMALLHMDWLASERLVWIYPALIVPCVATYALSLSLFRQHLAAFVSALAVVMNSYVYLLYQGGQFGVAMAYGCMPLVVWAFVRGQRRGTVGSFILTGTLMAVQALYDIRSTYITVGVLLVYGALCAREMIARGAPRGVISLLKSTGWAQIGLALVVVATLHLWWILPALFVRAPTLPPSYTDVAAVHPLSQMQLSNSLSLFHPFWFANNRRVSPINLLFFIVPLLVFGVLVQRRLSRPSLFLVAMALIAAFLVKGDNDPAGGIYDWLFVHLPGFSLFRDASKFYQPLALSYALLLGAAAMRYRQGARTARAVIVTGIFLMVAVFPAYPALLQQSRGTFVSAPVPDDYRRFNDFVDRQRGFFRVLWAPALPRFGTVSSLHPALDAGQLGACCSGALSTPTSPWEWLAQPGVGDVLRALAVRYIVVSDDTNHDNYIGQVSHAGWSGNAAAVIAAVIQATLPRLPQFAIGRLHVFVVSMAAPLLFTLPAGRTRSSRQRAVGSLRLLGPSAALRRATLPLPARGDALSNVAHPMSWYDVPVHIGRRGANLVLAQTYDANWLAFIEPSRTVAPYWATLWQQPLPSTDHAVAYGYANAWVLRQAGDYHVVLVYWPQRLVLLGLLIAALALLGFGAYTLIRVRRLEPGRSLDTVRPSAANVTPRVPRDVPDVQENRARRRW